MNLKKLLVLMLMIVIALFVVPSTFTSSAMSEEVTLSQYVPPEEVALVPLELVQKFVNLGLSTNEAPPIKFIPIPVSDLRRHRKTILKHIDPGRNEHERKLYLLLCYTT